MPESLDLADNKDGYFPGGFFVRTHPVFAKGETHAGHYHYVDHLSLIVKGGFRIDYADGDGPVQDSVEVIVGDDNRPVKVPILANMRHQLTALVDGSQFECWFSAQEADRVFSGEIKGSDGVPWAGARVDV